MSSLRNNYRPIARAPQNSNLLRTNGTQVNHGDLISQMSRAMTVLNELRVVERTPVFNLNAIYPLSIFRDVIVGTVTHDIDRYAILPASRLETAQLGAYEPGYTAEGGCGVIMDVDAEGRWGLYSLINGFFVQYTAAQGIQIGLRRAGVDTLYGVEDPEVFDPLDGTGFSGINYDPTEGYVFQIDFNYYGFGLVIFSVMKRDSLEDGTMYPFAAAKVNKNTSTANPNLPVTVENLGATGNIYCTGRQYSIIGKVSNKKRKTGTSSNLISVDDTAYKPIMSFRRRTGSEFDFYSLLTDALSVINGAEDIEYALVLGGTLTGAVPFIPELRTSGETAVEFDISATTITGGEMFYSDILAGSDRNNMNIFTRNEEEVIIPRNLWVTLLAKTLNPTTTSNVRSHLRVKEVW